MSNHHTEICREYTEMVFNRFRPGATEPLIPRGFDVNWHDQPSRHKVYRDVPRLALSAVDRSAPGPQGGGAGRGATGRTRLTYAQLSNLLGLSNGVLRRKLEINWNVDNESRGHHMHGVYARPAASGGGMYPYELYLLTRGDGELLPGGYHYDTAHHALDRLFLGDVTHRVRAATFDHPAAREADCFILISVNFWKNYFKYHNFCYHVVTQDVGAQLGTLKIVLESLAVPYTFLLWFRDDVLNSLLGLDTVSESVFAVVALGRSEAPPAEAPPAAPADGWAAEPLTNKPSYQRSRKIFPLPMLERVHASALLTDEPRPRPEAVASAACESAPGAGGLVALPPAPAGPPRREPLDLFLARASSWGKMLSQPRMGLHELAAVLRFAAGGREYACDVKDGAPATRMTRLMFFANHVQDLPQGVYAYHAGRDLLERVREGEMAFELQRRYALENYNFEQAAVVFSIVGSVERALRAFGNRGLRVLNAEVGAVAQHLYTAAAAASLGCGAVLGFDNIAINQLLNLENSDQTSLLLLLMGRERPGQGDFVFRIV